MLSCLDLIMGKLVLQVHKFYLDYFIYKYNKQLQIPLTFNDESILKVLQKTGRHKNILYS